MGDLVLHTVLKRSDEYDYDYLEEMAKRIANLSVPVKIHCIHDDLNSAPSIAGVHFIPMCVDLPGWWAKLNLFLQLPGGFIYADLDTVFVHDFTWMWMLGERSYLLSDLVSPELAQSGLMILRRDAIDRVRRYVWMHGMEAVMSRFRGDGEFLHWLLDDHVGRIQDAAPGRVASYMVANVAQNGVPNGASVVCFHGLPRPRMVGWVT